MIIEPEGRSFGFLNAVSTPSPFEPPGASHGLNCPSRYTCPSFCPHLPPHLCPLPVPRDLAPPEARVTGAEPVLQPRCERSVSPVWPPSTPCGWGSAQGECTAALKPWSWERHLLIQQSPVTWQESSTGKKFKEDLHNPKFRKEIAWGEQSSSLSAPTFLPGALGSKAANKMATGNPISSCPRPLVLEVNSGQTKGFKISFLFLFL